MNAFWINTKTNHIYLVGRRHIDFISDNPEVFDLKKDYILSKYKEFNEPLGFEGKARNEIIHQLLVHGWVRIRFNTRNNTWHINHNFDVKYAMAYCKEWLEEYAGNTFKTFRFINVNGSVKDTEIEEFRSVVKYMDSNNCKNCEYSTWAVGIGQGFFCTNQDKLKAEGDNIRIGSTGFKRFMIPRRDYFCEYFKPKES